MQRPEPAWFNVGGGVQFLLRAPDAPRLLAVDAAAARELQAIKLGLKSMREWGYDDDERGELGDAENLVGFGWFVGACLWCEAFLVDWREPDGQSGWRPLTDTDGQAIPVSSETIRAVLKHGTGSPVGPVFIRGVVAISNGDASRLAAMGEPSAP